MPYGHARAIFIGILIGAMLLLGGCSSKVRNPPQERFWKNLTQLCGQEFVGRVVADSTDSRTFRDKNLRLRVGPCDEDRVTMPMRIDDALWVVLTLTRQEGELTLKHDHAPGVSAPSGYGGTTRGQGVEFVQEFFADEYTIELDQEASGTIWSIELRPDGFLAYSLVREGGPRTFRAVFDLGRQAPGATRIRVGQDPAVDTP